LGVSSVCMNIVLRDCVMGDMRAALIEGLESSVAECIDRGVCAVVNLQTDWTAAGRRADEIILTAVRDTDLEDIVSFCIGQQ